MGTGGKRRKGTAIPNDSPNTENLSENVIRAVVQKGHTRNVVESTLEQLCNSGYKIQNLEHAVKRVLEEIEKQAELSIKVNNQDSVEKCEKELEQHKQEVRDRLLKVVSISSAVDVLNGLRKWVTIVPPTDRDYLFDIELIEILLKNIVNSQFSPSLQFSIEHFFLEVFHFKKVTSEVIKQNLITLSTQIQSLKSQSIFKELSQCLIEARVSDEEFSRRQLLQEIDTKITSVSKDKQPNSFSKLCSLYDIIITIPAIVHPTTTLSHPPCSSIPIIAAILTELEKEINEYHSSHSIFHSSTNQQRLFYSLVLQYTLESIGKIGDCRLKVHQYTNEVRKMEKDLAILQTLKMEQNIADVTKNQRLRTMMISKLKAEEDKRLYEIKDLEGKVSSLLRKDDLVLMREIIAHFYSICHVLKVDLTLSSEFSEELKNSIRHYRESDYSLLKKKPPKKETKQEVRKTWKTINPNPFICTISEIQQEELSKRQR